MKSYAAIDRIEGNYAVCEVELIEVENSNSEDYFEHPTAMMNIPVSLIRATVGEVSEDEVLVIEHDGRFATNVHCKSEEERKRRIKVFDQIMCS